MIPTITNRIVCGLGISLLFFLAPCSFGDDIFSQTDLVSDVPGLATTTDSNLVNPWGIANTATSPYWVSDQGSGASTLYNGLGAATALVVSIPSSGTPSGPTGIVSIPTGTSGFDVSGTTTAHFVFATLNGTITAWASGTTAVTTASVAGAVFTGLAFGNNGSGNFLYAANFVNSGGIEVFNSNFTPVALSGSFVDPNLPAGYAPYNVQDVGGKLYVEYAQVGTRGAQAGAGLGYVDVFDLNGNFQQRLVSGGPLNAPWGVALAPAGFGSFGNDLLVGNFGNGEINAFDPTSGSFLGTIDGANGNPLVNQDLWALQFGNGNAGSTPQTLFFTAGIDNQQEGLFGSISATPEPSVLLMIIFGLACLSIAGRTRRSSNSA